MDKSILKIKYKRIKIISCIISDSDTTKWDINCKKENTQTFSRFKVTLLTEQWVNKEIREKNWEISRIKWKQ